MRQIAVYGKGGSGKSTVVANVAVSLASMGKKVLQIGCDPKRDSTRAHLQGKRQRTVLDMLGAAASHGNVSRNFTLEDFVEVGRGGVHCVESGGPEPGIGCAGRGIIYTIETLTELGIFKKGYDVIFYDVLGDVVCGGFAMPIRKGYAREIYLVASGEFFSLYAANNICRGINRFAASGPARLAGLIGNLRNVPNEERIISTFAKRIGTRVVQFIPHSPLVTEAEAARCTVVEYASRSTQANIYRGLATKMVRNRRLMIPNAIEESEIEEIVVECRKSGKRRRK